MSGRCDACFVGDHEDCDDTYGYDDDYRLCWCECRDFFWGEP